uniref:Uncharacterized protein n=1 Tax=Arundo donax TaxID=35708 RepID=A0A0A9FIV7_ARUDO
MRCLQDVWRRIRSTSFSTAKQQPTKENQGDQPIIRRGENPQEGEAAARRDVEVKKSTIHDQERYKLDLLPSQAKISENITQPAPSFVTKIF